MRIQPREQIIDVWRAVATFSSRDGEWQWGGRDGRNSISDAEQLLCLLYPATEMPSFRLDAPGAIPEDIAIALKDLGDRADIPRMLVDVIGEYMATYTSPSGTPIFSGGSYFSASDPDAELTEEQRNLDVVDSFATSVSLTLSTLAFLKEFGRVVRGRQLREKITELEAATSKRLSAAMVGLLRSFSVNVIDSESENRALIRMLNQEGLPDRVVRAELNRVLEPVRASLRDATLGLSQEDFLDNDDKLFECGWSWGIVRDAPSIPTQEQVGKQPDGIALKAPFLYFTVGALDGIADLYSDQVQRLGLLNPDQQRLLQALRLRWDLTLGYWSTLARFGKGRWPLEDIPWRAIDDEENDYFSLVVTGFVLQELLRHYVTDNDLARTVAVLEELAVRGRVNRRMVKDDPAIGLHTPGVALKLVGGEDLGPGITWVMSDYAVLLLKRSLRAAGLSRSGGARDRLLAVAEQSLDHLWHRKLRSTPAAGLWDDPSHLLPEKQPPQDKPSWYMTKRVIECLVGAARTIGETPIRSVRLSELAADMIAEADHLFSQDELITSVEARSTRRHQLARLETKLARARRIVSERPATASVLVAEVLSELDELAVARQDAERNM